ncbi:hypothetical protein ANN_23982 [Periplaneta americana]|uniref:Uncharacterized protein n=1 Tax=Periplaneta americana TaxID=6978 RepID=A0ABQ8S245_PERAM|nr:hypothetical protein ANN_23982 [Periplaneta americana]
MAGLCEGGNEPPGSLKAKYSREFYYHHLDCLLFDTARYGTVSSGQRATSTTDVDLPKKKLTSVHVSKQFTFLPLSALRYVSGLLAHCEHELPIHEHGYRNKNKEDKRQTRKTNATNTESESGS